VAAATLESVNVGKPQPVMRNGELTTSAIWKEPLSGRVAVRGVNVDGDDQADRSAHGGPDQAVYAYAAEDTEWWEFQLRRPLGPGAFGENLTTRSINVNAARVGERWAIGTVLLEATAPRITCWKLAMRMGTRASSSGSRAAAVPAPTSASSRRASWAPATRSRWWSAPTTTSRSRS